jgi:hypothetical protein
MGVPYTQTVVLLIVVVGGVVGGAAVSGFGTASEPLTADSTDVHKPEASDVAFELRATLNNTGQTNVTKSVTLVMDGESSTAFTADERTVTVPADGTTTVTLAAQPDALTSERYSYRLVLDNGSAPLARGNVTFDQPTFAVVDHRTEPVVHGETATVTVDLHNTGDFRGMQTVRLLLDEDYDGTYANDTVATKAPVVQADGTASLTFTVDTSELEPGTYAYRLEGTENATEGTLTVKQPATFRLDETTMSTNLTRGDRFTGAVTVVNDGDVRGTETVQLTGPTSEMEWTKTVWLRGGQSTTIEFSAETANLTRGNYSLALTIANDSRTETLRIRESHLDVGDLSGPESVTIDEELRFTASVRNTGDAGANQTVEHRIDLDGDDQPETLVGNQSVELAPGEATTVEFTIPAENRSQFDDDDLLGTHIYGVYSADSNETGVVVVEEETSSSTWSSSSTSTSDGSEQVSRDVISQEKYGLYYDEVSAETQTQLDELYQRQPFADGLVVTEVLTREEIARQVYGLDVKRNDNFNFTAIDIELQQEIEATFDAQFESETGDRIESWDELAQEQFGTDYESLNATQQQTVRELYQEQFD